MGTKADKKFTWVIKNFSSLKSEYAFSEIFVIGGCEWYLFAYRKGTETATTYFSLYLMMVPGYETLPFGWKRHTKNRLTVVNQLSDKLSRQLEIDRWFDRNTFFYRGPEIISLNKLNAKNGGFVVNNEVKIVVEIDVLEAIGKLDVLTEPLKRTTLNHDGVVSVSSSVDVNEFQVLPSQGEFVKRIFEKYPEMALDFRAKNQHWRTSCINVLLNLIETLCQSLQDLSIDDLSQAEKALAYLKDSGFKMDWLEIKLEHVKEMKIEVEIGKTQMQELEEELKVFKKKCSDIEALLEKEKKELTELEKKCSDVEALMEKEKAKVLPATRAPPLTLDDVV